MMTDRGLFLSSVPSIDETFGTQDCRRLSKIKDQRLQSEESYILIWYDLTQFDHHNVGSEIPTFYNQELLPIFSEPNLCARNDGNGLKPQYWACRVPTGP